MATGTVKFFNDAKGFGFIERDDGGDTFCAHQQLRKKNIDVLTKDQRVRFDERPSPRNGKAEAYDVALL